jgi:hypothetical protein
MRIDNANILIGIFKSGSPGKYYLMLINKSASDAVDVGLSLPGNKVINTYPGSENYKGSIVKTKLLASYKNNITSFSIDKISSGEMIVLEIDDMNSKIR